MARTRSVQYPENRQLILDRAAALFAERGFPSTSIAEVAKACDFSKAWLYHYYESKEAILYAMLREHIGELLRVSEQALTSSDDPVEQFRAYVKAAMAVYVRSPHKHVVLMNDLAHLPPEQRAEIRGMERELVERVSRLLERLNPALAASPELRRPYAMMFFGMINWTYTWLRPEGPVSPERFADLAADLFLDGFLSQPQH